MVPDPVENPAARPTLPPRARAKVMMSLVHRIARKMARRVPSHVDVDDLVSAGALGLAESYTRRGAMSGKEFESFASCRIRGAILDELRSRDPLTRSMRRMAKSVDAEEAREAAVAGASIADDDALAARLGVAHDVLNEMRMRRVEMPAHGLVGHLSDADAPSPEQIVGDRELVVRMMTLAEHLPEREKFVFVEYYVRQRSQRDVATALGVTESRISQLHAKALRALADLAASSEPSSRAA